MQTYYHVTPARNLESIRRQGILRRYAKSETQAVWMTRKEKLAWAILHTAKRHDVDVWEVIVIEVRFRANFPTHHGRGLYRTFNDVPPELIVGYEWSTEVAR